MASGSARSARAHTIPVGIPAELPRTGYREEESALRTIANVLDHLRGSLVLVAAALAWSAAAPAEAWRWDDVERIVAISDVHGAAGPMLEVLRNAQVIDEHDAWSGGKAHLVVTGDLLDRGPESRLAMDLLMRLEREALAAGGRVHVLLGNHEAMNLVGDLRYVSAAEYAAFAEEESPRDRERAYAAFRAFRGSGLDEAALEREFALRAPPGFVAHRRAFAPDGRYGSWLLEKPLIVIINDTAFVHGGLSPLVTQLGLEAVNRELKLPLSEYAAHLATLTAAGVLDATVNFHRHPEVLGALPDDPERPQEIRAAIEAARELTDAAIHDATSPLWYRGNVGCSPLIEADKLSAALDKLDARRVVVGHTPTPGRHVLQRLDGRVVEIDTGMLNAAYGGRAHALIIDGGRVAVVDQSGMEETSPLPHPPQSAIHSDPGSAGAVEAILEAGEIASSREDEQGGKIIQVTDGVDRLTATFHKHTRKGIAPELAAYRLDRLLGLDMVPVTVARTVDGQAGALQLMPAAAETEAGRATRGGGSAAWCPLPEQWHAMYLFDALTGNERSPHSMSYSTGSWHLMLTGHGSAFGTGSALPRYLRGVDLQPGPAWTTALSALSDERLQSELGDVLDRRRLRALGKRRDQLLAAVD